MEIATLIIKAVLIAFIFYKIGRHDNKINNLMRNVELLDQENRRRAIKERKEI